MTIRCKIGLHKWEQKKRFIINDIFPFIDTKYKNPIRKCIRKGCKKQQYWLPGYGGSEVGCWTTYKEK